MEITVVTLVEEQISPWKGNFAKPARTWLEPFVYDLKFSKIGKLGSLGAQGDEVMGMRSIISKVSISPEGFMPSILLLVVIIVAVVMVAVILVVIVVEVVGVVIVVAIIGGSWAYEFQQDKASSVSVPVANATLFSSAQLLRENTDSDRSNQRMRSTAPSVLVFPIGIASTIAIGESLCCLGLQLSKNQLSVAGWHPKVMAGLFLMLMSFWEAFSST
ncbi:hypothetical protein Tco_0702706 [Tanacetum coccineum]|uniref:Uncharacterized protein n=1 Tax=Tanacetum coccineum TaxID=301880 RepID=A0ABQ4XYJ1_9ASTR